MFKYIILGIVQGLTEFLPVSSSGHLAMLQRVLGISQGLVFISVALHLGTIFSLIVFLAKDILAALRDLRILSFIAVVTLVTGAIGISAKNFLESLFASPLAVALGLIITGIILISTCFFSPGKRKVNLNDALFLGLTQGIAIAPGISRSGITIAALLFRGLDRETSFRFSLLASIPAVLGALFLKMRDIGGVSGINEPIKLLLGFIFSFIFGMLSLKALKAVVNKGKLHYFGYYCIVIGIATVIFIK